MSARDAILARLRPHERDSTLPERMTGMTFDDPVRQFAETLAAVGGTCLTVADRAAADARLREIATYVAAAKKCSLVAGIGETNFDLAAVVDPHDLHDVDFAVLPGRLAVAESAAVWVTDQDVPHRVLYFLPQHLALVVTADRIVANLHDAYAQLTVGERPFGCFISGPSKTADIEQALVIGAHGARSLTVLVIAT